MTWKNTTVADALGPMKASLEALIDKTELELTSIEVSLEAAQKAVNDANQSVAKIESLKQDAETSSISSIEIPPTQGAWDSVLLNAAGAPTQDANAYTAIYLSLAIEDSMESATTTFDSLLGAATSVIPDPPRFVAPPAFKPVNAVIDPYEKPAMPEPKEKGTWHKKTLASLMPGVFEKALGVVDEQNKAALIAQEQLDGLQESKDSVETKLAELKSQLEGYQGAGIYTAIIHPEATPSGSWYDRLLSAGPYNSESNPDGYPPIDSNAFVSGVCHVVQTATFEELVADFQEVLKLFDNTL